MQPSGYVFVRANILYDHNASLIETKRKHRGRKKTLRHVFDALHAPHSNLLSSSRPEFTRGTLRARTTRFSFSQTSVRCAIGAIVPWMRTFLPTSIYFSCRSLHTLAYIHLMPPASFISQTGPTASLKYGQIAREESSSCRSPH